MDLFIIVAISACVTLTCYQSMNILTNKYEYGILYANGFNESDMIFIIIMESLIKIIIAIVLVIPILAIVAMRFFQTLFESQRLLNKIIYFNALPGVVIAGLIITSASAIFPIILIKKSSAAELIGDTL
jgi:ABC-type antimicrobial peptide transport system permease subunit